MGASRLGLVLLLGCCYFVVAAAAAIISTILGSTVLDRGAT
jgi:hypothetical protein